MKQKIEKKISLVVNGSAKITEDKKGVIAGKNFYTFEEIFQDLQNGDEIKISINQEVEVEGGEEL